MSEILEYGPKPGYFERVVTCELCICAQLSTSVFSIINATTSIITANTTLLACKNVAICSLVVALGWVDAAEKEINYSSLEHGLNHVQ